MSQDLPLVESFYDRETPTFTHVVFDEDDGQAAIIDPVLDFEPARARIRFRPTRCLGSPPRRRRIRERRLPLDQIGNDA